MRLKRRGMKLLALFLGLSLVAAACGDDDDDPAAPDDGGTDTTEEPSDGVAGGELIDGGTIIGDPVEHIDPGLNDTLDGFQVINPLFDGLTDIDPETHETKPLVAESYEPNADATEFVFTIRDGMAFHDGEEILPSTFANSWERATNPDFAGPYSYLFNFITGGAEKLAGEADTISGVVADDEAMTLTVSLSAPYANFATVAGFMTFMPVHSSAIEDPAGYENGLMIGNGPYKLEAPRNDQEIVLVKNDTWTGDLNGETWDDRLDKITFQIGADPDTVYAALEAGEVHTANVPPGRAAEAKENYGSTLDVEVLGTYFFRFKMDDPTVGGPENKLLRQAISQGIDRDTINQQVYDGTRTIPTGLTPHGMPGYQENLCDYCTTDIEAATAAFEEWKAAGNELTEPIKLQFNADAGHEDVVAIVVQNLAAIGIEANPEPYPGETYFSALTDGACVFCRSGWYADYPTYDNFTYDLFHTESIGGNNTGFYSNPEFDALVDEAKSLTDVDAATELYIEAEKILLNEDIGVVPFNFYLGDYVYDDEKVAVFPQSNLGLIQWEAIQLKA